MLEKKIQLLEDKDIPIIAGKVRGSSKDFPFTEVRTSVEMHDPKICGVRDKLIKIKMNRLQQCRELALEIEQYIAAIPDSTTRQIFEMIFLEGKTYAYTGEQVGYTKGRVSQLISKQLKD